MTPARLHRQNAACWQAAEKMEVFNLTDLSREVGVEIARVDAGGGQRLAQHGFEHLQVGPAGDLGHHAPEPGVGLDLGRDHVRQHGQPLPHRAPTPHHGGRGLVAARLDGQHGPGPVGRAHERVNSSKWRPTRGACRSSIQKIMASSPSW